MIGRSAHADDEGSPDEGSDLATGPAAFRRNKYRVADGFQYRSLAMHRSSLNGKNRNVFAGGREKVMGRLHVAPERRNDVPEEKDKQTRKDVLSE